MSLMNHKYNNFRRKAIAGITLGTVLFAAATFLALSLSQHNPLAAA
jgi:orotate phosphoribosyltransferase